MTFSFTPKRGVLNTHAIRNFPITFPGLREISCYSLTLWNFLPEKPSALRYRFSSDLTFTEECVDAQYVAKTIFHLQLPRKSYTLLDVTIS